MLPEILLKENLTESSPGVSQCPHTTSPNLMPTKTAQDVWILCIHIMSQLSIPILTRLAPIKASRVASARPRPAASVNFAHARSLRLRRLRHPRPNHTFRVDESRSGVQRLAKKMVFSMIRWDPKRNGS